MIVRTDIAVIRQALRKGVPTEQTVGAMRQASSPRAFTAAGGKIVIKSGGAKTKKGQRSTSRKEILVLEVAISE